MKEPKNLPQTKVEMIEEMTATKNIKRKPYKVESDEHRADVLSALVNKSAAQLVEADQRGKISLSDTAAVKAQTMLYMQCCEQTGSFPSIVGLSRSLGYSRRAIYDEIDHHTNPATADWLEMCRDTFSDILAESALTNNANTIMAVFLSKAVYGLRESIELIAHTDNPLGNNSDPGTIADKYSKALPPADADETYEDDA